MNNSSKFLVILTNASSSKAKNRVFSELKEVDPSRIHIICTTKKKEINLKSIQALSGPVSHFACDPEVVPRDVAISYYKDIRDLPRPPKCLAINMNIDGAEKVSDWRGVARVFN